MLPAHVPPGSCLRLGLHQRSGDLYGRVGQPESDASAYATVLQYRHGGFWVPLRHCDLTWLFEHQQLVSARQLTMSAAEGGRPPDPGHGGENRRSRRTTRAQRSPIFVNACAVKSSGPWSGLGFGVIVCPISFHYVSQGNAV
jgi:hypothetical protein